MVRREVIIKMKNKRGEVMANVIIAFVVVVILTVIAISVTNELVQPQIEPQTVLNEAVTTSNVTQVSLANDDLRNNASCVATPYVTNLTQGTIIWDDTHPSNATTCNYSYFADNYITDNTTRTIMPIITLLFAVLGLIIIAVFAVKAIK